MPLAACADERRRGRHHLARAIGADRHRKGLKRLPRHALPVEDHLAAAQLDGVAGETDHPFDEIGVFGGMTEYHDVAALRDMFEDAAAEFWKSERQAVA